MSAPACQWIGMRRGRTVWGMLRGVGLTAIVLLTAAVTAEGANRYWVGSAGGNTNSTSNWSATAGSACATNTGATVPGSSDIAIFNPECTNNATINATFNVAGIDINTGYTGTITQNSWITVTVGSSDYDQADGVFSGGNSTIDVNGTFSLSAGTFTSTSGTLSVSSTFTISGSPTFTHNSGTVTFDGTSGTLTPSTVTFKHVTFNASGTKTIADNHTLTVIGTLTLTNGTIDQTTIPAGGSIAAQGDITVDTTSDAGTARIEITGTANQLFTGGGSTSAGTLPNIEIDKSGGTLTLSNASIRTGSDWTYTAGTLDATTNDSTVVFPGTATITGSHTLDNVTFDSTNAGTRTIADNATLTVVGTLTLTNGSIDQTTIPAAGSIAAQGAITQVSTFDGGTGRIEITGTANQLFTGGGSTSAGTLPNLEIDKSGGTLTLSSIIRISANDWTYTAGTLDATTNDSTLVFASTATITGSHTLDNVTFPGANTKTIANNATLTVVGTLTLTDGAINQTTIPAGGSIAAQGDITVASTFDGGTGRIELTGTANQLFTGGGSTSAGVLPHIEIDKSGGTLTLSSIIRISGNDWTYTAGTLDATTNDSTVVFAGTLTITGSHTLDNVTFDSTGTKTIASGTTLTMAGNLTITDGAVSTGTLQVQGDVTIGSLADGGSAPLTFSGGNTQTYTDNGGTRTTGTVTVNKTVGTAVNLATAMSYNTAGQDLSITSGTLDLASFNLTVNDVFTLGANGTLKLQGGETVSTIDTVTAGSTVYYNGTGSYTTSLAAGNTYSNLTFDGVGGVWEPNGAVTVGSNLTITNGTFDIDGQNLTVTGTFSNNDKLRLGGIETVSLTMDTDSGTVEYDGNSAIPAFDSLVAGNSYYHLILNNSLKSWTHTSTLDVNGNLTITAGTLQSSGQNITLAGNWSNSGTYTSGTNTVTLDGTNQTLSGTTSFSSLTKTEATDNATDVTLTFPASTTITITGTWTLDGLDDDDRINLVSSTPGTQWTIDPQGTRTIDYLDVTDSNNANGTAINAVNTNSTNSGNNTNWKFAPGGPSGSVGYPLIF